jgi:hypothetical protein
MAIALLPALFALEGAVPPGIALDTRKSIDVAAPPAAAWRASGCPPDSTAGASPSAC